MSLLPFANRFWHLDLTHAQPQLNPIRLLQQIDKLVHGTRLWSLQLPDIKYLLFAD